MCNIISSFVVKLLSKQYFFLKINTESKYNTKGQ